MRTATTPTGSIPKAPARRSLSLRRIDLVGIKPERVVDLPLLLVTQNIVGLGDFLESFLSLLITRIHVRMIFARKFAKGLANILRRGRLLYAQNSVVVFALSWWHFVSRILRVRLMPAFSSCISRDFSP